MSGQVICLVSSVNANPIQEVNIRNLLTTLRGKHIAVEEIDGVLPENKEQRTVLFKISGITGKYPQVFIKRGDETKFVGDYDKFQELCELAQMPAEFLAANPEIVTFNHVFSDVKML